MPAITPRDGRRAPVLAVVGGAAADARTLDLARQVGREIAARGAVLLCGGRGGVMAAAAEGARAAGGLTVGVLPGADARESPPNRHLDLALFTGLGQARNLVLVLSAAAVIAVGGGWGTLSEVALAVKHGRPVALLESWRLERPDGAAEKLLMAAEDAGQAVTAALDAAARKSA